MPELLDGALSVLRHARRHRTAAMVVLAAAVAMALAAQYTGARGWAAGSLGVLWVYCLVAVRAHMRGGQATWRYLGSLSAGLLAGAAAWALAAALTTGVGIGVAVAGAAIWWLVDAARTRAPVRRGANSHYNADGSAKVEYATLADAVAAGERLQARDGARMSAYRCARGRHWHIGHAR